MFNSYWRFTNFYGGFLCWRSFIHSPTLSLSPSLSSTSFFPFVFLSPVFTHFNSLSIYPFTLFSPFLVLTFPPFLLSFVLINHQSILLVYECIQDGLRQYSIGRLSKGGATVRITESAFASVSGPLISVLILYLLLYILSNKYILKYMIHMYPPPQGCC